MKIFYVIQQTPDYVQGWFFNNKRKAIEKGMEEVADFTFGQDMINQDHFGDDTDYYSGVEDVKEGFLFYLEDGEWQIRSEAEATAKEQVAELSGAYFPAKLKGGYAECYCSDSVTSTNSKWEFEYGEIYETKTTMKYVKLFEQFINESKKITKSSIEELGDIQKAEGYSANQYYILADFAEEKFGDKPFPFRELEKLMKSREVKKELKGEDEIDMEYLEEFTE